MTCQRCGSSYERASNRQRYCGDRDCKLARDRERKRSAYVHKRRPRCCRDAAEFVCPQHRQWQQFDRLWQRPPRPKSKCNGSALDALYEAFGSNDIGDIGFYIVTRPK